MFHFANQKYNLDAFMNGDTDWTCFLVFAGVFFIGGSVRVFVC